MTTDNYNLLDYIKVLNRCRRFIIFNFLAVSIIALLISFLLPKTFRSSAVLMPPITNSDMSTFSPLIDSPFGSLFSHQTDETMSMIAILKSRTIMEDVINQFDLINLYNAEHMEEAIEDLTDNIEFEIETEGTIRITSYASTGWLHPNYQEESN